MTLLVNGRVGSGNEYGLNQSYSIVHHVRKFNGNQKVINANQNTVIVALFVFATLPRKEHFVHSH